jgi:threonine aldolase
MSNQIAIRLHTELGDELVGEENCHVFISELGGPAVHSGVVTRGLPGVGGRYTAEQVRAAYRVPAIHSPRTRLLWIENTHNASGGRIWPLEEIGELHALALELDLAFHLDGARLLNASVAMGVDAAEISGRFDTVTLCLSKGLGCPLGAILAGRSEVMGSARRFKHLFGGAMRQAGIVAAAGVYALDNHVERLADDHRRAKRLALGLAEAGLAVDPDRVETNFVQVDVAPLTKEEAMARLAEQGVGLSATIHPTVLRAVTHLDVTDEDIDAALEAIPRALGARVSA